MEEYMQYMDEALAGRDNLEQQPPVMTRRRTAVRA